MKKVYTGKSIDEILASAAKEKNCDAEALYYEVKDEKAGFLGLGKEITAEVYSKNDMVEFAQVCHRIFKKLF